LWLSIKNKSNHLTSHNHATPDVTRGEVE